MSNRSSNTHNITSNTNHVSSSNSHKRTVRRVILVRAIVTQITKYAVIVLVSKNKKVDKPTVNIIDSMMI